MEILFENSYIRNKELAKEIYRYYYFQRKWLIAFFVFLIAGFICNILMAIMSGVYRWWVFAFVPIYFLYHFFCYFRQVNTMVKRDKETHGKEITVETIVTDGFIQNTASTGGVNKLEYDNIKSSVQTKNLILLRSKANLIYIFRKDTFSKGSKEEFILFLRNKGIQIK